MLIVSLALYLLAGIIRCWWRDWRLAHDESASSNAVFFLVCFQLLAGVIAVVTLLYIIITAIVTKIHRRRFDGSTVRR